MHLFRDSASQNEIDDEDEVNFFQQIEADNAIKAIDESRKPPKTIADDQITFAFTATSFAGPRANFRTEAINRQTLVSAEGERRAALNETRTVLPPSPALCTLPSLPSEASNHLSVSIKATDCVPNVESVNQKSNEICVQPKPLFEFRLDSIGVIPKAPIFRLPAKPQISIPPPNQTTVQPLCRPLATVGLAANEQRPASSALAANQQSFGQTTAPRFHFGIKGIAVDAAKTVFSRPAEAPTATPARSVTLRSRAEEMKLLALRVESFGKGLEATLERDKALKKAIIGIGLLSQSFERRLENLFNAFPSELFPNSN